MTKKLDKYIETFDEYAVAGIRHSNVEKIVKERMGEFDEWMRGQTAFEAPDGETAYFVRDVRRFINNYK